MSIEILEDPSRVEPYITQCCDEADKHKNELGFLPKGALVGAAASGRLFVAVDALTREYLGHILFGGKYPKVRIVQTVARGDQRRSGIGHALVNAMIKFAEKHHFLSVNARVASELEANKFWLKLGFRKVRVEKGGGSRGRSINILVRELDTPSLFNLLDGADALSIPKIGGVLEIDTNPVAVPKYTIDLNVVLDAVRQRGRSRDARRLLEAAMRGAVRITVTAETVVELKRNTSILDDPLVSLIGHLPILPEVSEQTLETLTDKLWPMVFPGAISDSPKHLQRRSDILHLANSIHHGMSGFITSDKALLGAARKILTEFRLDVLSLAEISKALASHDYALPLSAKPLAKSDLVVREFNESDRTSCERLLLEIGLSHGAVSDALDVGSSQSPNRRYVIQLNDGIAGIGNWGHPQKSNDEVSAHLFVSDSESDADLEVAIEYLLDNISRDAIQNGPARISIVTSTASTLVKGTAFRLGYRQSHLNTHGLQKLIKLSFPGTVEIPTHQKFKDQLQKLAGWQIGTLPNTEDRFKRAGGVLVRQRNREVILSIEDLEHTLAPVLFLFQDRVGIVVPIQRQFSAQLMSSSTSQHEFGFVEHRKGLFRYEKAYFRSPRLADVFSVGRPVVFYESGSGGGRSAAIGVARITSSSVLSGGEADLRFNQRGVLTRSEIAQRNQSGQNVHVFTFTAYQPFSHPVSFETLLRLGAADGANLISPRVIDGSTLASICRNGF